ncbi:SRPBCC family protein [Micromonospora cathayae]|uniref:SRPBCC domain-containing protein n=1 Tax=Micromonospora cathayae TaxID=3028804 RepID=A0ABY7ZYD6_9ACTN|nr:SRPBCC domain-containing protein [Micromonospora sp. HUAS 3]WDZ86754.1 SRPBCC domain-containing protein [Micromonospora sp. HUAS 3]
MTEPKPFRVEVPVAADRETVWSALTEPELIRQWFGWEDDEADDGLDEEIRHIFVDHAEPYPPDRIALEAGQELQVEADGERTLVRAVMPGALDGELADVYDALEEGWRTFFEQLRYLLEQRPAGERRTVRLTGVATGKQLLAVLDEAGPTERWHDSRYQRIVVDAEGRLLAAAAETPLDEEAAGPVSLVVSAYGLDDAGLADLRAEWTRRWTTAIPPGDPHDASAGDPHDASAGDPDGEPTGDRGAE